MATSAVTLADDLALARAVAAAVRAIPGVAAFSRGHGAGVATYGPGDTIHGVTITRRTGTLRCGIHLVARYPDAADLLALAARVREEARRVMAAVTRESIQQLDVAIDALVVGAEVP